MRTMRLFAVLLFAALAAAEEQKLPNGDTLRVWSEEGVDRAERRGAKNELLWYAALRTSDAARPLRVVASGAKLQVYDGDLLRIDETVVPPMSRETRISSGSRLMIQRTRHAEVKTLDLAKVGLTKVESKESATLWKLGEWHYAAFGPEGAPEVVVRFTIDNERMPSHVLQELGNTVIGQASLSVTDDGVITHATPLPTWFGEEMLAAMKNREAVKSGKALPKIEATRWVQSQPLQLDTLRGKVVLVDFWGVWCAPCRASIPKLNALADALKGQPFQLVAVHSDRQGDQVESFLKKTPFRAAIAVDTGQTEKNYGVQAWPTYILIDKNGRTISSSSELPDEATIRKLLAQ